MEKSPLSCIKQHSSPVSSIAEDIDFTGGTGDSGLGTGESDRTAWIYKTPASSQTGKHSKLILYTSIYNITSSGS